MSIDMNRKVLEKGWKRFMIMSQNRHVATIREDGTCTIYTKRLMPYDLYLETAEPNDLDTKLNNLENFYHWCASRVLTLDRKYAKEILNSIGAKQTTTDRDRAKIAISYHGLSLTDVYWIKSNNPIYSRRCSTRVPPRIIITRCRSITICTEAHESKPDDSWAFSILGGIP